MSDRRTDIAALRQQVLNAERLVVDLTRQLTEKIVTKQPVGRTSDDLNEITEARNFFRARLNRLEGANHG